MGTALNKMSGQVGVDPRQVMQNQYRYIAELGSPTFDPRYSQAVDTSAIGQAAQMDVSRNFQDMANQLEASMAAKGLLGSSSQTGELARALERLQGGAFTETMRAGVGAQEALMNRLGHKADLSQTARISQAGAGQSFADLLSRLGGQFAAWGANQPDYYDRVRKAWQFGQDQRMGQQAYDAGNQALQLTQFDINKARLGPGNLIAALNRASRGPSGYAPSSSPGRSWSAPEPGGGYIGSGAGWGGNPSPYAGPSFGGKPWLNPQSTVPGSANPQGPSTPSYSQPPVVPMDPNVTMGGYSGA